MDPGSSRTDLRDIWQELSKREIRAENPGQWSAVLNLILVLSNVKCASLLHESLTGSQMFQQLKRFAEEHELSSDRFRVREREQTPRTLVVFNTRCLTQEAASTILEPSPSDPAQLDFLCPNVNLYAQRQTPWLHVRLLAQSSAILQGEAIELRTSRCPLDLFSGQREAMEAKITQRVNKYTAALQQLFPDINILVERVERFSEHKLPQHQPFNTLEFQDLPKELLNPIQLVIQEGYSRLSWNNLAADVRQFLYERPQFRGTARGELLGLLQWQLKKNPQNLDSAIDWVRAFRNLYVSYPKVPSTGGELWRRVPFADPTNKVQVQYGREYFWEQHTEAMSTFTHPPGPPAPRPLLFVHARAGTLGDAKPMAILAVLAAKVSSVPVHMMIDDRLLGKLRFFLKFAEHELGPSWAERLVLRVVPRQEQPPALTSDFFNIDSAVFPNFEQKELPGFHIDIGDGKVPAPRFVSCLLQGWKEGQRVVSFGSLFLPLHGPWSDGVVQEQLDSFATAQARLGRKILGVAGSMGRPVEFEPLTNWLVANDTWACVCVNYSLKEAEIHTLDGMGALRERMLFLASIEFENLVGKLDFYLHTCGAGSTVMGFAFGCPQMCGDKATLIDKWTNNLDLFALRVGPTVPDLESNQRLAESYVSEHFREVMQDFLDHEQEYRMNSRRASGILLEEYGRTQMNVARFFSHLSRSSVLQDLVTSIGIPEEFGWLCEEVQHPQRKKRR